MQRVEHIDYLKGFAILMVLLGHIFIAKAPSHLCQGSDG